MDFPFSHHWQGSIDFNTVNTTHPTGMNFLIHPLRASSIDSVKIDTYLPMMRECKIHPLRPQDFPRPSRFFSGFALRKFLGSREISWALGMDLPIPPSFWWSTDTILSVPRNLLAIRLMKPGLASGLSVFLFSPESVEVSSWLPPVSWE